MSAGNLALASEAARQTHLPERAEKMLERQKVHLPEAIEFLGIGRTLAYPMARRYMRRMAKLAKAPVIDPVALRPQRDPKTGAWREIPAYQVGQKYMARTDLIVPMVYPDVPWP